MFFKRLLSLREGGGLRKAQSSPGAVSGLHNGSMYPVLEPASGSSSEAGDEGSSDDEGPPGPLSCPQVGRRGGLDGIEQQSQQEQQQQDGRAKAELRRSRTFAPLAPSCDRSRCSDASVVSEYDQDDSLRVAYHKLNRTHRGR